MRRMTTRATQPPPAGGPAWPSTSAGRVVTARDKITRAEELRLMLADEIVSGQLEPGSPLDETNSRAVFRVAHAGA